MDKLVKNFVTLGPIGLIPVGSGTLASLLTAIIACFISIFFSWKYILILIITTFFLGYYFTILYLNKVKLKDPPEIVIDEVVGQLIASIFAGPSIGLNIIAFFLFRFFDILKPYPINKFEEIEGGLGVMLDDVMAGFFSMILIIIISYFIIY